MNERIHAALVYLMDRLGAWGNTMKNIETGTYGGKGSEAHKAAIRVAPYVTLSKIMLILLCMYWPNFLGLKSGFSRALYLIGL